MAPSAIARSPSVRHLQQSRLRAIKWDFLSGSERMLIDVWNIIILLGSSAFSCSWLVLIKQHYFPGPIVSTRPLFSSSHKPAYGEKSKETVALCITKIFSRQKTKGGGGWTGRNQPPFLVFGSFIECCFWVRALHLDSSSCQLKRKLLFCLLKRQQISV